MKKITILSLIQILSHEQFSYVVRNSEYTGVIKLQILPNLSIEDNLNLEFVEDEESLEENQLLILYEINKQEIIFCSDELEEIIIQYA